MSSASTTTMTTPTTYAPHPERTNDVDIKRVAAERVRRLELEEEDQFAADVVRRMRLVDASLDERAETALAFELDVAKGMTDAAGEMHRACAAFLVETCASVTAATASATGAPAAPPHALNLHYHAPALIHHRVHVHCRTLSSGTRPVSVLAEIWDATSAHLCVSGTLTVLAPHAKL